MSRILKYQPVASVVADMPLRARIVKAGAQDERLTLWALVTDDDERETGPRRFICVGAGAPLPDGSEYVDTFFEGPFVWHVIELAPSASDADVRAAIARGTE